MEEDIHLLGAAFPDHGSSGPVENGAPAWPRVQTCRYVHCRTHLQLSTFATRVTGGGL